MLRLQLILAFSGMINVHEQENSSNALMFYFINRKKNHRWGFLETTVCYRKLRSLIRLSKKTYLPELVYDSLTMN